MGILINEPVHLFVSGVICKKQFSITHWTVEEQKTVMMNEMTDEAIPRAGGSSHFYTCYTKWLPLLLILRIRKLNLNRSQRRHRCRIVECSTLIGTAYAVIENVVLIIFSLCFLARQTWIYGQTGRRHSGVTESLRNLACKTIDCRHLERSRKS